MNAMNVTASESEKIDKSFCGISLITMNNCRIESEQRTLVSSLSWTMKNSESWLLVGPNGGGKADFLNGLTGRYKIVPNKVANSSAFGSKFLSAYSVPQNFFASRALSSASAFPESSFYANSFSGSVEEVSLEKAARLIQEERENDESEYIEGGVDHGRTGRIFIAEAFVGKIKKGLSLSELPELVSRLESFPEIKLCGVEKILDRGLKYMSTGEIRRTLLARALLSKKKLLILSDPFAGLDSESRKILLDFFDTISSKQLANNEAESVFPRIILSMERYVEIPNSITNVLEFAEKKVSFCGTKSDYEKFLEKRNSERNAHLGEEREEFRKSVLDLSRQVDTILGVENQEIPEVLVEMKNVNVGWGNHQVLRDFNWKVKKGEHWFIRGPNGSGKTTLLELITGDNQQVFCNDVKLFGKRRGSGETIWGIKHKLGICSYRLHVEYRMVGSSLLEVIVSGFHDSIGLYENAGDVEIAAAEKWLELGGFKGRENETFNSLSYGEQRAVLILRASVKCPPILIMDEPCHGLDEDFRRKILDLLSIIAESGTTTLLHVTHEPSEVLPCEKHILELCPDKNPMYKIYEE